MLLPYFGGACLKRQAINWSLEQTSMDALLSAITDRLAQASDIGPVLLIGIDGAGGSGKSTLAADLVAVLERLGIEAQTVHMDDFYLPSADRPSTDAETQGIGDDFDWRRLREQVLIPLSRGQRVTYQRYDWHTDALAEWHTVACMPVVIVEGVYTLRQELGSFYDLTIWVDCPRAIRLARGIARDGEQGRALWEGEWMPREDRYIAAHQPHLAADWVYDGADA